MSSAPKSCTRASTTACVRCRQKKRRCDQKLPRCRLCELAGVECYGYDVAARRQVPRSYVQSLEERVVYLEAKLREHGLQDQHYLSDPVVPPDQAPATGAGGAPEPVSLGWSSDSTTSPGAHRVSDVTTFDVIPPLAQPSPSQDAEFSRILLTGLLHSAGTHQLPPSCRSDQNTAGTGRASDIVSKLDTGPITLPTKEAAVNLAKEYFQCSNLGMPLLHEPTFHRKLTFIYNMPHTVNLAETHRSTESRTALFFVLEVFAVALLSMQKRDPSRIPTWLADRHHSLAVRALIEAGLPNDVEGVQALLLIGQFYYLHPTLWAVWNTIGAALRLGVELGLHQDPRPDTVDALTLDTRRRTFWVAYSMERNISIAKAMPSCLSDGAIRAEFPSEADDSRINPTGITTAEGHISGAKLVSLHLFRYRQIQSEIRTVLFERPSPPYAPVILEQWQQQMRDRINSWYGAIPPTDKLNSRDRTVIETFELTYHTALFYLHRPSTNNPTPSGPQLVAMARAAANMIQLYRRFFLEQKLTIYWQAVENLYSAGTALMSGYTTSPQVREYITYRSLESIIHICSSVLWGMVERFPAFQGKRDAFDAAASIMLADLSTTNSRTEGSPVSRDSYTMVHSCGWIDAEDGAASTLEAGQHWLAGEDRTVGPPVAVTPTQASPKERQPPLCASLEIDGEPGLDTQSLPLEFADFGDLSMVWEATADLSATFTPAWI